MQQDLFAVKSCAREQDEALSICLATKTRCDFTCTRDGAPNCHYFVVNGQCQPGREAMARLYGER